MIIFMLGSFMEEKSMAIKLIKSEIICIDENNFQAIAEPGVITQVFQDAVKEIISSPKKYGFIFREKDLYSPVLKKEISLKLSHIDLPSYSKEIIMLLKEALICACP